MQNNLLCLYPQFCENISIEGLYLAHQVHKLGTAKFPFVYANFLSSLDGRIALDDIDKGLSYIPKHLTTASDFRLFMELHAQADCLITHGGYMRALSEGRLGNILQIKDKDLIEWRRNNGLKPQPAVVIASASLNFPFHDSLLEHQQTVYIATGKDADSTLIHYWQNQGRSILMTGEDQMVHGAALISELTKLGYKSIYLIAGPQMLDTVIREKQLSRLYLTITHQLIGGKDFRTLLTGPLLNSEGNLMLETLYYEPISPNCSGQFFLQFNLNQSTQSAGQELYFHV
jgi:riboflavin biosynthesis pyrimidine reductase